MNVLAIKGNTGPDLREVVARVVSPGEVVDLDEIVVRVVRETVSPYLSVDAIREFERVFGVVRAVVKDMLGGEFELMPDVRLRRLP